MRLRADRSAVGPSGGWLLCLLFLFVSCRGDQSALDPAGHQAEAIAGHWWFFLAVCTVVYVIVAAALLWALLPRARSDRRAPLAVSISAGITVTIVFVLVLHAVWTARTLGSIAERDMPVIEVTGHQWWWEVSYLHGETPVLRTANEMHLPVGQAVALDLKSRDVIHSFWVPKLHGKVDMIPGRVNRILVRADRPGVFRGQCAEFCGLQHAHMGLVVVAQPRDEYDRWLREQRLPAPEPANDETRRGREVFVSGQCAVCHTVRGTTAFGNTGPDLTHLASRRTIAAATLPNTRGHLGGWIADPQAIKPGNRMPPSHFESEDFNALLAYLESLR